MKLDFGDYSFYIPAILDLNIFKPTYFNEKIAIERKANLSELNTNVGKHRERFENELKRASNALLPLMIEDAHWGLIKDARYRGFIHPNAYIASLMTFMFRYDFNVNFVSKDFAGEFIYKFFYYWLREQFVQEKIDLS